MKALATKLMTPGQCLGPTVKGKGLNPTCYPLTSTRALQSILVWADAHKARQRMTEPGTSVCTAYSSAALPPPLILSRSMSCCGPPAFHLPVHSSAHSSPAMSLRHRLLGSWHMHTLSTIWLSKQNRLEKFSQRSHCWRHRSCKNLHFCIAFSEFPQIRLL